MKIFLFKPVKLYALFVFTLCSSFSMSIFADEAWKKPVQRVTEDVIQSGYKSLAENFKVLEKKTDLFCTGPTEINLEETRGAWRKLILSWMEVSWVHFGAVSNGSTRFDIQIWPIRKGITHKTVNKLIAQGDQLLDSDIDQAGVSIRGITGSEYLLFSASGGKLKHYSEGSGKARCQVLKRSIANGYSSAEKLSALWSNSSIIAPYYKGVDLLDATKEYESAASIVWNALLSELEFIQLRKLEGPINEHGKKAKPTYAESWRSLHSFQNITHQLDVLKRVYSFGFSAHIRSMNKDLDKEIVNNFDLLHQQVVAFQQPMKLSLSDQHLREKLLIFRDSIHSQYSLLRNKATPLTGFVLGFNANDGD